MKVFVTGATGFVGREVLAQLHAAGDAIVILARHPQSRNVREAASRCQAEVRPGDVLDPASLQGALSGIDALIHLVGIISEVGSNTFENVHVAGTWNIVRAAQAAGVKRCVHMSALGARPGAVSRYHQTKWQAEEIVRNSGLDFTIFRPSIIYGPGDMFVNQFAQMARWSPVLPIMGQGDGTFQPIAVEWVARSFVQSLREPQSLRQTFDLAGPEVLTLEQIMGQILEVTGRKRLLLHLPLSIANLMADVMKAIYPKLLGKAPPLNRDQLAMLGEKTVGAAQPAWNLFKLKPGPFREGISKFLCPPAL